MKTDSDFDGQNKQTKYDDSNINIKD